MKFELSFTADDLKIIEMGLLEIPTKFGAPMLQNINAQVQKHFDAHRDAHDTPSGQTAPKDAFAGD